MALLPPKVILGLLLLFDDGLGDVRSFVCKLPPNNERAPSTVFFRKRFLMLPVKPLEVVEEEAAPAPALMAWLAGVVPREAAKTDRRLAVLLYEALVPFLGLGDMGGRC